MSYKDYSGDYMRPIYGDYIGRIMGLDRAYKGLYRASYGDHEGSIP